MSRSSTIIEGDDELLPLIPPGEILVEDFMKPLGISQNRLARDLGVPVSRVAGIVSGDRSITADTALRLGSYFGTSPDVWLGLQMEYDLRSAKRAAGSGITSSVIAAIEHDGAECLTVTFVSGRRYAYAGVPPTLYREFLAAPSKGAFFSSRVRDEYPTQELAPARGRGARSAA